jgi:hypothetical protein
MSEYDTPRSLTAGVVDGLSRTFACLTADEIG